jgi:glucose/arabinose dehydrogenase
VHPGNGKNETAPALGDPADQRPPSTVTSIVPGRGLATIGDLVRRAGAIALVVVAAASCSKIAFEGADQAAVRHNEVEPSAAFLAPAGFRVELVAEGFNYPSAMAWDERGRLYVLESHSVPLPLVGPQVVRVDAPDRPQTVELEGPHAPTGAVAVGLVFHDGWFYLSHSEQDGTWAISRFRPRGGNVEPVLRGIPATGDHWVNHLAFDRSGALWFGVGSATNSGVVSSHDPVNRKWLKDHPEAHDIPCRDIVLRDATFEDDNALTEEEGDAAITGAYQPYGESGATRIAGERMCTTALYKLAPGAREPELVAWGFRNPVGLAIGADGTVYVGAQGADVRGTRPVADDPDAIYRVERGGWYGWPDFSGALEPLTAPKYAVAARWSADGQDGPRPLFDLERSGLRAPDERWLVMATAPHAAICGISVIPGHGPFAAWRGQILVSEMGDFRPTTDAIQPDVRAGFQIELVDPATGKSSVFLRNRGDGPSQPASTLDLDDGLERPVDVRVGPDGYVYVLDFGVWVPTPTEARIFPKTGKVFRVVPASATRKR